MHDTPDPRIIVALDFDTAAKALDFVLRLDPTQCRVKVGSELFTAAGPALVETLAERGFGIFLDLKYHDIPNTVAAACRAAAALGVWMMNVHAAGGRVMLAAARDAVPRSANSPKLIAVTVLTSLAAADLPEVGLSGEPDTLVLRLAALAKACGLDGAVCSAQEAHALRATHGPHFDLVTPGIRPSDVGLDDQQRVMTPAAAVANGSSYLVIGRAITRAPDPLKMLERINRELAAAMHA